MDSFGFIITRHVNSHKTNRYWNQCVKCIRLFYPEKTIIIIDDNSNPDFLSSDFNYKNIQIFESEFKGRGELLPYLYFIKYNFFKNAVIIHDSVFFHRRINFEKLLGKRVMPLWHFYPDKENVNNTLRISNNLKNSHNISEKIYSATPIISMPSEKWYGCFGVQSFINREFLIFLENKYALTNLINSIKCRPDRCSLERIMGCIFFTENKQILQNKSIFGNIMKYQTWGYSFDKYESDLKKRRVPGVVVKVWTGR